MDPADLDLGFARIFLRHYDAGREIPPHEHPFPKISLIVSGSVLERSGSRQNESGSCCAVVKPAGVTHSNRIGAAGARIFTVRFEPKRLEETAGTRLSWRYGWSFGDPTARSALATLRAFHDRAATEPVDEAPLALLASMSTERCQADDRTPPRWLADVIEQVRASYRHPVAVRDLADRAGVHPVHLTRVFRRFLGCSVRDYLRRLRVQAAADQIASREPVALSRVALDAGFADQAHLSRVFKRATGLTPGAFRSLQ